MMTDEELAAIEARCQAATPGPWRWSDWDVPFGQWESGDASRWRHLEAFPGGDEPRQHLREHDPELILTVDDPVEHESNRAFIAHARGDVPVLLAEVRRLREQLRIVSAILE